MSKNSKFRGDKQPEKNGKMVNNFYYILAYVVSYLSKLAFRQVHKGTDTK